MKKLLLLLSVHFIVTNISAQIDRTIDSIATSQQKFADIPGFAVGVILHDKIIFEKVYGVQSVATHRPLTFHSDFDMASVSKPFTATAIMQLVEKGKLSLDSPLIYYLPYFKMKDERYKKITLYQILTHSSGIPDVKDYEWDKPQTDDGAAERYVSSFADKILDFAPGAKFNYSNAAFDLLADVIAKAFGLSFEEYIRKNIFMPAGMAQSSFLLSDIPVERRALPHVVGKDLYPAVSNLYPYNRIHAPSSTLHSDLDEMLKWAALWIHHGTLNDKKIIGDTRWKNMLSPRLQANTEYKICLSWFEVTIGTKKIYFHSGGDIGYRTFVGFDPEDSIAVVLMGNNDLFNAIDPAFAIFKSILLNAPAKYSPPPIFLTLRKYILTDGIKKVKEVYHQQKRSHPDKYSFGAANTFTLADWLYDKGFKQQAIDVLIFCAELDPKNYLWYEYIGDIYAAWNKKEDALPWYRKAFAIGRSKNEIEQKIEALQKK